MMVHLTRNERLVYGFIVARLAATGVAPTLREISCGTGLNSRSLVDTTIEALEDGGCIRRSPRRARAIEVVARADRAAVRLNPEILALTDRYASEHQISRDTAANELLRSALEAA